MPAIRRGVIPATSDWLPALGYVKRYQTAQPPPSSAYPYGPGISPPLKGIKILDLTRVLAGPTATMLLADLGADVIKVEEITRGDDTRQLDLIYSSIETKLLRVFYLGTWHPPSAPLTDDAPAASSHLPPESAYFLAINRNKRSVTVNFKEPEGLEIIHKLVKSADILVENFVSGKLASLGLGWEDCKKLNDRLIYASITGVAFICSRLSMGVRLTTAYPSTGYGQTGPFREAAGYDVIIEAEAGLMHM